MTRITRVEVITNNGREYVSWEDDNDISYMLQDSNRTLKVFVGKTPPEQPITEEENERYFEEAKQIVENHFAKKKMTEIEKTKKEIEVLTKKLSFLEELSQTKSPVEEAYKRVYGYYPEGRGNGVWTISDADSWIAFQNGYSAAQEDYKVGEYQAEELKTLYQMVSDNSKYKTSDEICDIVKEWMSQYTHNVMSGEYLKGYEECLTVLEENLK
jgi:ketol-acid reductoisomerase